MLQQNEHPPEKKAQFEQFLRDFNQRRFQPPPQQPIHQQRFVPQTQQPQQAPLYPVIQVPLAPSAPPIEDDIIMIDDDSNDENAILVNDPNAVPADLVRVETVTQPPIQNELPNFPPQLILPQQPATRQQVRAKHPFPVKIPGPKNARNLPVSSPILITGNFKDTTPAFIVYRASDFSEYPLDSNPLSNQSNPSSNTSDANSDTRPLKWKIPGLTWKTEKGIPQEGIPGTTNSCTFDPFMTAVRIQFSRTGYDHMALLKSISGQGKLVEDFLRISLHVVEAGGFEYNAEGDIFIKFLWINFIKLKSPFVQKLQYDMIGGEDSNVFDHIEDLTQFKIVYACSECKRKDPTKAPPSFEKVAHHFVLRSCDPDEYEKALKEPFRHYQRGTCTVCNTQSFECVDKIFPETTWVLAFHFFNYSRSQGGIKNAQAETKHFRHESIPNKLKIGNVWWRKVYLSYSIKYNQSIDGVTGHQVSFHLIKNAVYKYDDMKHGGYLTRAIIRDFQANPNVSIEKVVYFRMAPRSRSYCEKYPLKALIYKQYYGI